MSPHTRTDEPVDLVVGILTFKRPEDLAASLPKVLSQVQALAENDPLIASAHVLVVDNDPAGSARNVVAGLDVVRYAVETTPGIAAARNRVLSEAADARLLVFIDDDEEPDEHWLEPLVQTWRATGASAVMGRVVSHLPAETEQWVVLGGFFSRPQRATGTEIPEAAAGNLLLDLEDIRRFDLRFDQRLALGGGEDSLFTRQLVRAGGRIVWCNESLTHDYVAAERANRAWTTRRAWSHGNTRVTIDRMLAERPMERLVIRCRAAVGGAVRIGVGALRTALGVITRSVLHRVKGVRGMSRGAGMFVGAFGVVVQEYARPEPSEEATLR